MRGVVKLVDVYDVVFVFENCSFVVIDIEVVWSREDCYYIGEFCCLCFMVYLVVGVLCFMSLDDGK